MGMEEFVDLDIEEFQRRANERLMNLIERHRPGIEADLGGEFQIVEHANRVELAMHGRTVYLAGTSAAGRLLLTDVSGRYDHRL